MINCFRIFSGRRRFNPFSGIWALFFLVYVAGCAEVTRTDVRHPEAGVIEAQALMDHLGRKNIDLRTFKGLGTMRLKEGEALQTMRVAWMVELPEKLRIEALAVSGQPMVSIAGDGQWLYLLSHSDHRFYKKQYASGFDGFFSIPVQPSEMIALLGGKIPVAPHHTAHLMRDPDSQGYRLVLKKRWQGIAEKIYLDPEQRKVLRIERFDSRGNLVYQVKQDNFQAVAGFELPFWIQASGDDGSFFELTVERWWTNVPVDPEGFALRPKTG